MKSFTAMQNQETSVQSLALVVSSIKRLETEVLNPTLSRSERRTMHRELRRLVKLKPRLPSKHHRIPKEKGGSDDPSNISIVPMNQHAHFHALFDLMGPEEIAHFLTEKWIDSRYEMIAVRRS